METNKQVQTIEVNGVKVTIEQQPTEERTYKGDQAPYSWQLALIMSTLADLLQEDWAPNAVGELMYEAIEEKLMDGAPLPSPECEQAMTDIATACEDFANALANIDAKFSINYMSRRR